MPSAEALQRAILEAAGAEVRGVAMGAIVDGLSERGFRAEDVELAIWALMGARLLTPSGFICRRLRRRSEAADGVDRGDDERIYRAYELLLVPWSPADDRQLDLDLDKSGEAR
ncbi:MAG: hypothetical protein KC486_03980 [Myxococcales bacterium]|nr:hypothetical protein [Myxococcales bacterium]